MNRSIRVLLAASAAGIATGAVACSNSTAPSGQPMTLSFSSRSPVASASVGSQSPSYSITVASGANTVVITKAQLVVRKIELKSVSGASCPETDQHGDSCEELQFGPTLVDLPLTAGTSSPLSVNVPAGQYRELELQVHKPGGDARDVAFKAGNPTFANISVRVEGTFNGTPFVYTSTLDQELEMEFSPALTVGTTGGNITIQVDVATWFRSAGGAVVDPATANVGGVNESAVREQIKRSIRAVEDNDRDGR